MTNKQNLEIKATFTYGCKLPTGKLIDYEFVKQDFEKNIDVPSKQIIIDEIDVTGCEYCSRYADTTIYHCDWIGECKEHPNCYYKQLKRAEQKLAKIKEIVKYYAEIKCEDCKYLSVHCVDCNEIIEKEVIRIIEGKENDR